MTGLGVVSAAGIDVDSNVAMLSSGKTQLASVRHFRTGLNVPVGEVALSDHALKSLLEIDPARTFSRTSLLGIKAVKEALEDHCNRVGKPDNESLNVVFVSGASVGGMDLSEGFWEENRDDLSKGDIARIMFHDPGASSGAIYDFVSRTDNSGLFRNAVPLSTTISTACSSAGNAIMLAARMIRSGMADIAIAGGADSLCRFTLNGFNSLRILDVEKCRPFDATRAGLNLGEGAGYLVLSAADILGGQADAYCELSGWGNADEAYHQTASTPEGVGPGLAMLAALNVSGLAAEDIDFVNTHGTGTPANDLAESNAMIRLFAGNVPAFSSLKPFFGHTLGASESVEAAMVCRALRDGSCDFMRQLDFSEMMPETGLCPYNGDVRIVPHHILSSAFGFGGNCVSLVFSAL